MFVLVDVKFQVLNDYDGNIVGKKLVLLYKDESISQKEAEAMMKRAYKKVKSNHNFHSGEDYVITIGTDDEGRPYATCTLKGE